ncbi:hypothetical protein PGIGA_G00109190, partial [Pangasianodon gigas]|nr:hypothetical protein [Pangasianodon gigas]
FFTVLLPYVLELSACVFNKAAVYLHLHPLLPRDTHLGQIFLQHVMPPWLVYWPNDVSKKKRGMPQENRNSHYMSYHKTEYTTSPTTSCSPCPRERAPHTIRKPPHISQTNDMSCNSQKKLHLTGPLFSLLWFALGLCHGASYIHQL